MKTLLVLTAVTVAALATPYHKATYQGPSIFGLPQTIRSSRPSSSDDFPGAYALLEEDQITSKIMKNPLHDPLSTHQQPGYLPHQPTFSHHDMHEYVSLVSQEKSAQKISDTNFTFPPSKSSNKMEVKSLLMKDNDFQFMC